MKSTSILAVLFDMGGTLEDIHFDDALRLAATPGLKQLLAEHDLDPGLDVPSLYAVVKAGMKSTAYGVKKLSLNCPRTCWSEYVLANQNLPSDRVAAIGEELAFYYEMHFFQRTLRPDAKELIETLFAKGLT